MIFKYQQFLGKKSNLWNFFRESTYDWRIGRKETTRWRTNQDLVAKSLSGERTWQRDTIINRKKQQRNISAMLQAENGSEQAGSRFMSAFEKIKQKENKHNASVTNHRPWSWLIFIFVGDIGQVEENGSIRSEIRDFKS